MAEGDFDTSSSYETNKRYVHRNDVETQAFSGVCYWGFQTKTQELPSWLCCPLSSPCPAPRVYGQDVFSLSASDSLIFWDFLMERLQPMTV